LPAVHEKADPQRARQILVPAGCTRLEFWQTGRYNYPAEVARTNPKGQALSGDHWLLGRVSTPYGSKTCSDALLNCELLRTLTAGAACPMSHKTRRSSQCLLS
jgi:hypothetical protein